MEYESKHIFDRRHAGFSVKKILQKIFIEDWLIKLLALGITLGLWFGVTGLSEPTTTRLTDIPLTLRFASNVASTSQQRFEEVDIVISGDKRKIDRINKTNLVISVDLTDVQPGDRIIQLSPEHVTLELPTGVKLVEILPNRIPLHLEAVEEKEVEVKVETEGRLADGYEIYSETVTPPRVRVSGPASFVRSLTVISTEKIDITDKTSDFSIRQVALNIATPNTTVLESVVDVTFRIGEIRMERIFLVPLNDGSGRRDTVVLYGPRSVLLQLKPSDIELMTIFSDDNSAPILKATLPPEIERLVEIRQPKS